MRTCRLTRWIASIGRSRPNGGCRLARYRPEHPGGGRRFIDIKPQRCSEIAKLLARTRNGPQGLGHGQLQRTAMSLAHLLQALALLLGIAVKHGARQLVGRQGGPLQPFIGRQATLLGNRAVHRRAKGAQHDVGQAPQAGHLQGQLLVAHAVDLDRGGRLAQARLGGHALAHLARVVGKIELGQKAPKVAEHGRNEGLFAIAMVSRELAGKGTRDEDPQELLTQAGGVGTVAHVLQQDQAQGQVADAIEADQADRARHRSYRLAARVVHRVDQSQQALRQADVLENFIGQAGDTFAIGARQVQDARDNTRQTRKLALLAHARKQAIKGCGGVAAVAERLRHTQ